MLMVLIGMYFGIGIGVLAFYVAETDDDNDMLEWFVLGTIFITLGGILMLYSFIRKYEDSKGE